MAGLAAYNLELPLKRLQQTLVAWSAVLLSKCDRRRCLQAAKLRVAAAEEAVGKAANEAKDAAAASISERKRQATGMWWLCPNAVLRY